MRLGWSLRNDKVIIPGLDKIDMIKELLNVSSDILPFHSLTFWRRCLIVSDVTNTRRRDHITPVLADLHWLPVRYRIEYTRLH